MTNKLRPLDEYFKYELTKLKLKDMGPNSGSAYFSPKKYIFLTSRYRTGSTYLYSLFSSVKNISTYLEPLHPNILEIFEQDQEFHNNIRACQSHTLETRYFSEYQNLIADEGFCERYTPLFASENLIMTSDSDNKRLKEYLLYIIGACSDKLNVLQFNRIDFRLAWIRENFSDSLIVNLRRNPRDIFMSHIKVYEKLQKESLSANASVGGLFYLDDYIGILKNDLLTDIDIDDLNDYEKVYILNNLSNLWSDHFSDVIIEYESLIQNPLFYLNKVLNLVIDFGLEVKKRNLIPSRRGNFNQWKSYESEEWFRASETKCDQILQQILSSSSLSSESEDKDL